MIGILNSILHHSETIRLLFLCFNPIFFSLLFSHSDIDSTYFNECLFCFFFVDRLRLEKRIFQSQPHVYFRANCCCWAATAYFFFYSVHLVRVNEWDTRRCFHFCKVLANSWIPTENFSICYGLFFLMYWERHYLDCLRKFSCEPSTKNCVLFKCGNVVTRRDDDDDRKKATLLRMSAHVIYWLIYYRTKTV